MKRVMIIGFSGAGKSTLASDIADIIGVEPTYMDKLNWLPGWVEDTRENKRKKLSKILERESWVIDGSYRAVLYKERMKLADTIIFLDFNRLLCFYRAIKRRVMYNGKTRPDMTEGCYEKMDVEFAKWVLIDGRKKRKKFYDELEQAIESGKKIYVFHRPCQVKKFLEELSKGMVQ